MVSLRSGSTTDHREVNGQPEVNSSRKAGRQRATANAADGHVALAAPSSARKAAGSLPTRLAVNLTAIGEASAGAPQLCLGLFVAILSVSLHSPLSRLSDAIRDSSFDRGGEIRNIAARDRGNCRGSSPHLCHCRHSCMEYQGQEQDPSSKLRTEPWCAALLQCT